MKYRLRYRGFDVECETAEEVRELIGLPSQAPVDYSWLNNPRIVISEAPDRQDITILSKGPQS